MQKFIWVLLLLLSLGWFQENGRVEIYRVEKEDRLEIYARNTNIYPVTVELDFELENLTPSRGLPYTGYLSAQNNQKIMELYYSDKRAGWDYRSKYRYYMGNIFARHNDAFAYRLPYPKGEVYKVDQGFGGVFSHQGDLQYALDFNMPVGTEIYAARAGKVVLMEESNNRGGASEDMMDYANYITIMHDDGTFADYSHLQYRGVNVELGEEVRMGQLIGYSGATGFATGPHLHFVVKKTKRGGGFISIPVKFTTKDGIQVLQEGNSYIGY